MADQSRVEDQALNALHRAALAITAQVSLEKVLQQITDSARELVGAHYAALGVPDAAGYMEKFFTSGMPLAQVERIPHRPRGLGLLGAIIRERRVIRLAHIGRDPRSVGFPPNHPPMDSFLGVPIVAGSETLGNLYLTDKIRVGPNGREAVVEFTERDQILVEMLAAQAAVAIQNARLYEQISRLAIVEERSRIGMDLHDGVIQSIYAVGLTLESARLMLPDDPQAARRSLEETIGSLNDVIRDIRNFILDLRPQRFSGDLNQALGRLIREFQANAMVPVRFTADPVMFDQLPAAVALTIFVTTQEALANVARHARASQVNVQIWREDGEVILDVADNGEGFSLDEESLSVGHGLANMRARAEERQGAFTIETAPGEGTRIRLRLPE